VDWRPGASLDTLRARAGLLQRLRAFFARAGVLEVETPLACRAGGTDPALEPLVTRYTGPGFASGTPLYLQSSPEFAMKRLLAAGAGPIYQLGRAFRDGERGRRHNPEFTLLEWYRPGFHAAALMSEVAELVRCALEAPALAAEEISYAELFRRHLGLDVFTASVSDLRAAALAHDAGVADLELERDAWLDLLMTTHIEPRLGRGAMSFVTDYPAGQAALARLNARDPRTAARFELFLDGVELANGFEELTDAREQAGRFRRDNRTRAARGQPELPVDERFLAALAAGLPPCAGVALGVDRLLMRKLGIDDIDRVMAFSLERA
jgi:lysyl-tRNA synthetase class 2